MASTDKLTRLSNRAAFDKALVQAMDQARASGESFAVFFMDVDFFKRFNDTYGHHVGDEALRVVAEALRSTLGAQGTVARYGGEEFVSIVSGQSEESCRRMAEAARGAVEKTNLQHEGQALSLTTSVGVAFADAWPESTTGEQVVNLADEQLYKAKRAGRNRVEFAAFAKADQARAAGRHAAA